MTEDRYRRHTEDIERMISEEPDPRMRNQLIITMANTAALQLIAEKLDTHLTAYEAQAILAAELLNKGRGAWRVLAWVLGTVLTVGAGVWVDARKEVVGIKQAVVELVQSDIRTSARVDANTELLRKLAFSETRKGVK